MTYPIWPFGQLIQPWTTGWCTDLSALSFDFNVSTIVAFYICKHVRPLGLVFEVLDSFLRFGIIKGNAISAMVSY